MRFNKFVMVLADTWTEISGGEEQVGFRHRTIE